jgi:diguanylate cyclase (GGDEF)-like protein
MEKFKKPTTSYFWSLLPIAIILVLWAVVGFRIEKLYQAFVVLLASLSGIIYFAYRRNVKAVRRFGEQVAHVDRRRAEEAENYVRKLRHYVRELEKSGEELRASREQFRAAATQDGLTGLANRNHFIHALKDLMRFPAVANRRRFAVLFLDLNRFKMVNDSLGHLMGDRLIVQVAERLSRIIGSGGLVARFGGDEFAILLADHLGGVGATAVADDIARELSASFQLNDKQVFVGVSMGIAFDSSQYSEPEEILRDADIAMYYAKESQRHWIIFDEKMHSRAVSMLELETDLRYAIERDELELYYQPIIALDQMRLSGFEALARWRHPTRGIISPTEFINVCEETGLIVPMTVKLLRMACEDMVEWQLLSPEYQYMTISVNISGKHFSEPGLIDHIRDVLEQTGIYPPCLKLEITESAIMRDAENTTAILREIKDMGVQLSIDDFGTGYSSLSYLHRFPVDTLKIDRSFVSTMEDGTENGEIVRTVITLARALKMNVIAEGIESIHQLHQLRILNCEYGQGFLFSRAVPAHEVRQLFDEEVWWKNIPPVRDSAFHPDQTPIELVEVPVTH